MVSQSLSLSDIPETIHNIQTLKTQYFATIGHSWPFLNELKVIDLNVSFRVKIENPPEVIRWNTHKSYLLTLQQRGESNYSFIY